MTASDQRGNLRPLTRQLACASVLAVLGWLGYRQLLPPNVVPASVATTTFSSERALASVRTIAAEPHPMGSDAARHLHDWLIARLDSLGFVVTTQDTIGFLAVEGWPRAARVQNIVARRAGARPGRAVLLMAHYDAVPRSFGASDDGAGVAAVLEIARALQRESLDNDLLILLSDGEEAMLLGAEAFFDLHPWARDVAVAVNLEARGTRGASLMFQTSARNGALIDALAATAPSLRANSLMGAVYRLLPNDTDLSLALDQHHRYGALNFAFIEGYPRYHTPTDDLAHLDPRSLQQQGENVLAIVRALVRADLATLDAPDQAYFDLPLLGLAHYPASWSVPLALLAMVLALLLLAISRRRRAMTWTGLASAFGVTLLMLGLGALVGQLGWWTLAALDAQHRGLTWGEPYFGRTWLVAWGALLIAAAGWLAQRLARHRTALELVLAPLLLWSFGGIALAVWLPGASYLLIWPAFAGLAAAGTLLGGRSGVGRDVALALLAAPALWIWLPLIFLFESGLTIHGLWVWLFLVAAMMSLLMPAILAIGRAWRVLSPALAVLGVALASGTLLRSGFSPAHPRQDSLLRVVDADARRGWWVTLDRGPDAWTRAALGASPRDSAAPDASLRHDGVTARWSEPASDLAAAPAFAVLSDDTVPGGRRYRVHVGDTTRAHSLALELGDSTLVVHDLEVGGRAIPDGGPWSSRYAAEYRRTPGAPVVTLFGMPAEGMDVGFTVSSREPARLAIVEVRPGLPPFDHRPYPARPAGLVAAPMLWTDVTLIRRIVIP